MHEFSVIENIFTLLTETAAKNKLFKIDAIYLKVGKLRQLVPEFMAFAFETISKDTIAAGAKLHIEEIPVTMRCQSCGHEFGVPEKTYLCPQCKSGKLTMLTGDEIILDSVVGKREDAN